MHVLESTSVLDDDINAQSTVLLDADVPIKSNDVGANTLNGSPKAVHDFTVAPLHDDSANSSMRWIARRRRCLSRMSILWSA